MESNFQRPKYSQVATSSDDRVKGHQSGANVPLLGQVIDDCNNSTGHFVIDMELSAAPAIVITTADDDADNYSKAQPNARSSNAADFVQSACTTSLPGSPSLSRDSCTSADHQSSQQPDAATSEDGAKRVRRISNRFVVSTMPQSVEDQSQLPPAAVPRVISDDDEVFHSNSPEVENGPSAADGLVLTGLTNGQISESKLARASHSSNAASISRLSAHPASPTRRRADLMAEQGRRFAKRQTERLILKGGECSVVAKNVPSRHYSWYRDLFTTLLDLRWRYNLIVFAMTFVGSWFLFALLWWLMAFVNGDRSTGASDRLEIEETFFNISTLRLESSWNDSSTLNISSSSTSMTTTEEAFNATEFIATTVSTTTPCVDGVHSFVTALLFSVETQQTIGYGTRYITSNCSSGMTLMVIQALIGILLQSLMTGIVYSKLCRPKSRAHTVMFSRYAVICQRDEEYCLLFRVGDMRRSYLIGTSIRALVIKSKDGEEKLNPHSQHTMELEMDQNSSDASVLLIWPVTMVHRIDDKSPLWNFSMEQLVEAKFEIVIVLEGTIEHTGMTAQFRASYLPSEILWGHHLAPLLTYQRQNGKYEIDFTRFDNVLPVENMPYCSAKDFASKKSAGNKKSGQNLIGFATGLSKRNGSQSIWPRVRKIIKSKEFRDETGHHEHRTNKSNNLMVPVNPDVLSTKRGSIDLGSLTRSLKKRQERTRSLKV